MGNNKIKMLQKQIMQSRLLFNLSKRQFSQGTLMTSLNTDRNHNLRVMSTPTWPVPYYQRAFRHPAHLDRVDGNLSYFNAELDDSHVIIAKELLKMDGKGYVVEAIEQHYDVKSYVTAFEDSKLFSAAYTDDLLDCLGVAHEQNVKILNDHDLSNVFDH